LSQTMALLDEWQAPEPSPYFDTRLHARLREEMAKQPVGWFHWVRRPAMAISFLLLMVVGVTLFEKGGVQHPVTPVAQVQIQPGTAVGDLQALDKNLDLYSDSDSDVLDDLEVQPDVTANP
jgi:hypothetical protein